MNKKIIVLGIVGMFLLMSCASLSAIGEKVEANEQSKNTQTMTGFNEVTVFDIQVFNTNNEPVFGVNIYISFDYENGGGSWSGVTDGFGRYYDEHPRCQGQVKILFSRLGYYKQLFEYDDIPVGHRFDITLTMERKSRVRDLIIFDFLARFPLLERLLNL